MAEKEVSAMKMSVIVYGLTAQQEALLEAAVPEEYKVVVAESVTELIITNSVIAVADMAAFSKDGLRTLLAYYMDVGQRLDETVVWLGNGDLPDLPSFVRCGSFLELLTDLEGIISRAQSRYDTMQMFCGGYDCLPKHAIAESMEADVYTALRRKCGDNPDVHTLAQVRRQWQAVLEAGAAEELATVYELARWLDRKGEPYEIQCAAEFSFILDLLDIPTKPGSTPEAAYQFTLPQHLQPQIHQWQQHHWNACGKMPVFVFV
jgi:hypothetical protein